MLEGTTVTGENMRNAGLMMAALMAASGVALAHGGKWPEREQEADDFGLPKREPEDRGRHAEKDAAALAKAEAKRARKAAKRIKNTTSNA